MDSDGDEEPESVLGQFLDEINILIRRYKAIVAALLILAGIVFGVSVTAVQLLAIGKSPPGPSFLGVVGMSYDDDLRRLSTDVSELTQLVNLGRADAASLRDQQESMASEMRDLIARGLSIQTGRPIEEVERRLTLIKVVPVSDDSHTRLKKALEIAGFEVRVERWREGDNFVKAGEQRLIVLNRRSLRASDALTIINATRSAYGDRVVGIDVVSCAEDYGLAGFEHGVGVPWAGWGRGRRVKKLGDPEWDHLLVQADKGLGQFLAAIDEWWEDQGGEVCGEPTAN